MLVKTYIHIFMHFLISDTIYTLTYFKNYERWMLTIHLKYMMFKTGQQHLSLNEENVTKTSTMNCV